MSLLELTENRLLRMLETGEISIENVLDKTNADTFENILHKIVAKLIYSSQTVDLNQAGTIYIGGNKDSLKIVFDELVNMGFRDWDGDLQDYRYDFTVETFRDTDKDLPFHLKKYFLITNRHKRNFIIVDYNFGSMVRPFLNRNLQLTQIEDNLFIDM